MIPKIIIKFNKFLDPIFTEWIQSKSEYKDWTPPTKIELDDQILMYKREWDIYGEKILKAVCNITGLDFKRNQIDVHIVSGNPRPFSNPIVMKSRYDAMDFINTLTHELIHCLFQDNKETIGDKPRYPHENEIVKSHVIVHAILKYIYLDILNEPERLEKNIDNCSGSKHGYDIAWDIVEKGDYKELISRLK